MKLASSDYHVHTKFSFDAAADGSAEPKAILDAAIANKLDTIAICDHCDIDGILEGIYPPYEKAEIFAYLGKLKEEYFGKINILIGIELGQPHVCPDEARKMLANDYDFVLGSLHNLRGYPDFYFLKYELMTAEHIEYLVKRSITEQIEIAKFKFNGRNIDSLAHITYIGRYLKNSGVSFDFLRFEKDWRELFHIMIENGIALEINTSGLRRGSVTMPDVDLIKLYKDSGGKKFTLGSDAHSSLDVGKGIFEAFDLIS